MPSKFKKAIAAVKDQTSIGLAKVGGAESSSLEVAILKATTHEEVPIDEKLVIEVLQLVSSNRSYAGSCARAIGRRIGRTRSWVVAVKSLMLVLRIFQDGDPHFPKEVLHAMKRGYKILNLSSFRDDSSTSCPWDFTAFVRTFALYLDERLDCFVTGKLQRRTSYAQHSSTASKSSGYANRIRKEPVVRDMKPAKLLDRISHWQRLLDRAVATRPTGAAKTNRLVHTCLYAIVQETFDLYRDISDGLALLLDSFFHLQYTNCVNAFQTCVRASKQFEELNSFYELCKSIGVGRTSEYPSVQKVSQELIETLQEFLKDQSSFPCSNGRSPSQTPLPNPISPRESEFESVNQSDYVDKAVSEYGGSHCTSLEDLISADSSYSPERYSDPGGEKPSIQIEEYLSANDTSSVRSDPTDSRGLNAVLDLLSSPPPELQAQGQDSSFESSNEESSNAGQGWELVLFEPENETCSKTNDHNHNNVGNSNNGGFGVDWFSSFDSANPNPNPNPNANANGNASTSSSWPVSSNQNYNPFLQDNDEGNHELFEGFGQSQTSVTSGFPGDLGLGVTNTGKPTFQAEFGNNIDDIFGHFSTHGFTSDLGIGNNNDNDGQQPTFRADFGSVNDHSSADFPPTFCTDYGSVNVSNNDKTGDYLADLFSGLSHNSFKSDFGHTRSPNSSNVSLPTLGHASFGVSDDPSTSSIPFADDFGSSKATIPAISPTQTSNEIASPAFANNYMRIDNEYNAMNAIVPYSQATGNDDLFSSVPSLQTAPTFRATSSDMDQSIGLHYGNDLFGSLPARGQEMGGSLDQQSVLQQQQLWLQNQRKIMARHLT